VFLYPYSPQWKCFIIHCHPGWEVLISLFAPKWKCFHLLIHHSEGVSMNILIQLKWRSFNVLIHPNWEVFLSLFTPVEVFYVLIHHCGGVSSCIFIPMEALLHPYSLQWRCLCMPQWRCFHILIHPGQCFLCIKRLPHLHINFDRQL